VTGQAGTQGAIGATGATGTHGPTGLQGPRGATGRSASHRPHRPAKSSGAHKATSILISVCDTVHDRLVCSATVAGHDLLITFASSSHRVSLVRKGVRYALVTVTRKRHGSRLTIVRQFHTLVTGHYQAV
jgi:hypothetical protein